jgi:N-acetyl-anhydromuramyl-L-alanine amidase AmpD
MPAEGRGNHGRLLRQAAFWAAIALALFALPALARAPKPPITSDPISFGAERKRQTAAYSERHYGSREWRLTHPDVIVLHFTGSDSYTSAWSTFESNAANLGERPGVCAHYVIKQSGAIAGLVPTSIRCRHAIGLNHRSIGIEMVQATGPGSHWADRQILDRRRQVGAALRLVRWLQGRYGIAARDVIGHAMANDHRWFKDLQGWRNDHTDWLARDVREFRDRLERR